MSKHTPGPFYLARLVVDGKPKIRVSTSPDGYGILVAEYENSPPAEPFARLISAAPELLEALKAVLAHLSGGCGCTALETCPHRRARAAIAKAEDGYNRD